MRGSIEDQLSGESSRLSTMFGESSRRTGRRLLDAASARSGLTPLRLVPETHAAGIAVLEGVVVAGLAAGLARGGFGHGASF